MLDIGINRLEVAIENSTDFWYSSRIIDQGDLSTYYGYKTFDASGYTIKPGKVYTERFKSLQDWSNKNKDPMALLKSGYTYVRITNIPKEQLSSPFPLHLISSNYEVPEFNSEVGVNPTFLLEKNGVVKYAIINGFFIDIDSGEGVFENGMIYR